MNRSIGPVFLSALVILAVGFYFGFMANSYDEMAVTIRDQQTNVETCEQKLVKHEEEIAVLNERIKDLQIQILDERAVRSSANTNENMIQRMQTLPEQPLAALSIFILFVGIIVVGLYALLVAPSISSRRAKQDPNGQVTVTMNRSELAEYRRYLQQHGRGSS